MVVWQMIVEINLQHNLAAHGTETIYFTYGKLVDGMLAINNWLARHPREIVVLRFGDINGPKKEGMKELKRVLEETFTGLGEVSGINDEFRKINDWPTLKDAINSNKRVFIFVTIEVIEDLKNLGDKIIGEIKVKSDQAISTVNHQGTVKVLSTYSKTNVGSNCEDLVHAIESSCKSPHTSNFTKIDMFSNLAQNLGNCLWTVARECNSQLENAIEKCELHRPSSQTRILMEDYPNYPGPNKKSNVDVAYERNKMMI